MLEDWQVWVRFPLMLKFWLNFSAIGANFGQRWLGKLCISASLILGLAWVFLMRLRIFFVIIRRPHALYPELPQRRRHWQGIGDTLHNAWYTSYFSSATHLRLRQSPARMPPRINFTVSGDGGIVEV